MENPIIINTRKAHMNKKEFIVVLVITFTVFVAWLIFDIVHTKASVQINPKLQKLLDPVTSSFDKPTLDRIKSINFPPPANTPVIQTNEVQQEPIYP